MYLCVFVQARARLDLREKATKGDAEDVVEIMKHRWNYRSLIIIVSINLFTAVKHVKWVVLLLVTYVQWCLYCLYYASVWLWWHLVTISALYLSCAVLRCKMCLSPSVCVCVYCFVVQSGWYVLRWSRQSGLWALSARGRHESAQRCKTTGQCTALSCPEDQSDAVWPTNTPICGWENEHKGESIHRH